MMSFHLNIRDINDHTQYSYNWQTIDDAANPDIVARVIRSCMTSSIVWFRGRRKSECFMHADWIVLDIDNGMKLQDGMELFKDYVHVIGTTKRHRLIADQNGDKLDRFRVWLLLQNRCDNLNQYIYNVRFRAAEYGADIQAVDGARKFMPCKTIESVNNKGSKLSLLTPVIQQPKESFITEEMRHRLIPRFVREMFDNGVADGQRNKACYTVARYLGGNGFSQNEIVSMLMGSRIPKGPWCENEVRNAVRSGMMAIKKPR